MKKRNLVGIALYLLGVVLFVLSNSSIVSGSPIHLEYFQRVILCGVAVCSIGTAPCIFPDQNTGRDGDQVRRCGVVDCLHFCIWRICEEQHGVKEGRRTTSQRKIRAKLAGADAQSFAALPEKWVLDVLFRETLSR